MQSADALGALRERAARADENAARAVEKLSVAESLSGKLEEKLRRASPGVRGRRVAAATPTEGWKEEERAPRPEGLPKPEAGELPPAQAAELEHAGFSAAEVALLKEMRSGRPPRMGDPAGPGARRPPGAGRSSGAAGGGSSPPGRPGGSGAGAGDGGDDGDKGRKRRVMIGGEIFEVPDDEDGDEDESAYGDEDSTSDPSRGRPPPKAPAGGTLGMEGE